MDDKLKTQQTILTQLLNERNPAHLGVVAPIFLIILAFVYQSFSSFKAVELVPLLGSIFFFSVGVSFSICIERYDSTDNDGTNIHTTTHETVRRLDSLPIFAWIAYAFAVTILIAQLAIWIKS